MAEAINVMIALQTPDGLAFGYVLDASPKHVTFTVNNNLAPGVSFAWRMELKGYSETIMGRLTVSRAYPARSSADWPRYDAKIDEIPPADGKLLAVWMEDQEKGGSSRRLEKDPDRFIKDMFSEGMRGASSASTKLVIERMNERTARREQLFKKKKRGVGGDFGLSRESAAAQSSSVSRIEVRSRISSALGGFSRRKLDESPATPAPPPAEPPRKEASPPSRANPTAEATVGQAPAPIRGVDKLPLGEMQARAHGDDDGLTGEAPASRTPEEIVAAALASVGLAPTSGGPPAAFEEQPEEPLEEVPVPPAAAAPEEPVAEAPMEPEEPVAEAPMEPEEPVAEEPEEPEEPVAEEPEEPEEPEGIVFDHSCDPPLLVVRYPQAGSYVDDYRRHLKNGGLFLTGRQLGTRGQKFTVRLTTPAGTWDCAAQVVAVMPAGTGLMLTLTRDQRAALAAAAT